MMILKVTVLNSVASIISKWRTFEILRWVHLLNRLVVLNKKFYGGDVIEYFSRKLT
jgi:hypothetical protein